MKQNTSTVTRGSHLLSDTLFALQVLFINGIIFSVIFWITDAAGRGDFPQATPALAVSIIGLIISAIWNKSVDKKLYANFKSDF